MKQVFKPKLNHRGRVYRIGSCHGDMTLFDDRSCARRMKREGIHSQIIYPGTNRVKREQQRGHLLPIRRSSWSASAVVHRLVLIFKIGSRLRDVISSNERLNIGKFRGVSGCILKVLGGFGCIRACTDLTGHSVCPYKFRGTFRVDQGASGRCVLGQR